MTTREKIIEILEKEKGHYVSGERLAGLCGVSRNAVWKNVSELKKKGYSIQSVNNRGYLLDADSDVLSAAGIRSLLKDVWENGGRTFVDPDRIAVYDELDSTNSEAKRLLLLEHDHLLHGTVIAAKSQTKGKGHGGRSFSSPDGGIYLSIILEPEKMKDKEISVPKAAGRAAASVLERLFGIRITRGKDGALYEGRKKVCGILTEGLVDLETGQYTNYIIGIGIRAGELQRKKEKDVSKNRIAAELIKELDL